MSEHLPDCPTQTEDDRWRGKPCYCDRLRACEARVNTKWLEQTVGYWPAYDKGYAAALDRATEVVAAVPWSVRWTTDDHIAKANALAAIDALREKP